MITIGRIARITQRFFKLLGDDFARPAWNHFWGMVLPMTISQGSTLQRLAKLLRGADQRI